MNDELKKQQAKAGDPQHESKETRGPAILEQVEERQKQWHELATDPDRGPNDGELTTDQILEFLDANELGDGFIFAHKNLGKFLMNKSSGTWLRWAGHHWTRDLEDRAKDAVEVVAQAYLKAGAELQKKIMILF